MADAEACPAKENVVRAITTADYDPDGNRYNSSLFKGAGTSVSRLAKLSREAIVAIFIAELDNPPRLVLFTGTINVGDLTVLGEAHTEKPVKLTVVPRPTKTNKAHAEIPQKITRGLSKKIIEALHIEEVVRGK